MLSTRRYYLKIIKQEKLNYGVIEIWSLEHPPHSPDLAQLDYHFFGQMKDYIWTNRITARNTATWLSTEYKATRTWRMIILCSCIRPEVNQHQSKDWTLEETFNVLQPIYMYISHIWPVTDKIWEETQLHMPDLITTVVEGYEG